MKNLLLVLLLALAVKFPARAANTISSTNIAWPTNVAADADLMIAENTNRPTPFKTISVTVANLFSNRTARGTWDFSGATVSGLSSLSAFATNVFTNGFWSGYVSAQGRTGATNAPFRWNNTNGVAILDFRTNNLIVPTADNVVGLGQSGNNLSSVWTYQLNVGTSGNGDVRLAPNGSIGWLNFTRIDGGTSSGITMDGNTGAKITMPNAGGTYQFYQNSKLVDIIAAGIRFPASNSIMFYSYNPSAVGNGFTQPDSLVRAYSNSAVVISGTNSTGATPLPTGSLVASNVFLVGSLKLQNNLEGVIVTTIAASNHIAANFAPVASSFLVSFANGGLITNNESRMEVSVPITSYCPPSADWTVTISTDQDGNGTAETTRAVKSFTVGTTAGAIRSVDYLRAWISPGQVWKIDVSTNGGAAVDALTYNKDKF